MGKRTEEEIRIVIDEGKMVLGIELGSTRIKTVLIDEWHEPIASGSSEWENSFKDGIWTYALEEVWIRLQESYRNMVDELEHKYHTKLRRVAAIGFSAMMHGYLAFDVQDELLVPFRTWRNSITEQAAHELTELFQYNIPQRWSIAHLYQAVLNGESHVENIRYLTTLAGYVHWKLTGKRVIGIGDASGMFPIDIATHNYDAVMADRFDKLLDEKKIPWKLREILPEILEAGEQAGILTDEGARLLDPTGMLRAGSFMAPPEGDAQTGMVATNSIAKRTGNVSAGTSVFAIIILERELCKVYPEIDLITTPEGHLAANIHVNNGTSDLNAWVGLFGEFAECFQECGDKFDKNRLFEILYRRALEGDSDCGGLLSYGYYSGENIMDVTEGRPLFVRMPDSNFNLANFMRSHLYSALAALKVGTDILREENVQIDSLTGHGGLFKTEGVCQRFLAAAFNAPVSVMETAGEGGAWGMALLAAYMLEEKKEGLALYLDKVFAESTKIVMQPVSTEAEGFKKYTDQYKKGITIERCAVQTFKK